MNFLVKRGVIKSMSTTLDSSILYSNDVFKRYLMNVSTGIVWKNTTRATDNESTDLVDLYQAELFVVANRGLLNYDVVKAFPRAVLLNSAIPETYIEEYASDKTKIPEYLRPALIEEYTKALTSVDPTTGRPGYYNNITGEYEVIYNETNNYYRMLMGLPDIDDYDYIYNTDTRWSTTTPIHEMSYVDRIEMERDGILDELKAKYPTKEYIEHLGKKYIDPFTARIADRFEILYQNTSDSTTLNEDFNEAYTSARKMAIAIYYNNAMRKNNELYDNFIAMCILFMAIQQMQYKYLQVDITRDFYDTESLKMVYDSYSVPFYSEIPLEYHRKIVKNINNLISYKGSSQVFFDLFDIFDLGTMSIYSYFLTKTHILDENGVPLFNIKQDEDGNDMYDDEGNPILDESNYELNFSRIKLQNDPSLAISDEANRAEYESVTESDPYWIEDAELVEKLSNENFNYLESKYLGIQTVFDLMKITYENAYIFRMITDNKELTSKMSFRWSELGSTCNIFEMFIYLASLYCRYYGYEGVLTDKLPPIMDTLGYDFNQASELLKNRISMNSIIRENTELYNLMMNITFTNANSLNSAYDSIMSIRDIVVNGYTNATSINEFNAYRELYDALMISKEVTEVYTNPSTGELYDSFSDLLSATSPSLMQRYLLIEDSGLKNEIVLVVDALDDVISSLKYLSLSMGLDATTMIEPLFKILKFFKSAKAELVDCNIVYVISNRGLNFFKMMDAIQSASFSVKFDPDYKYSIDLIHILHDMVKHKNDVSKFTEKFLDPNSTSYLKEYIRKLDDDIVAASTIIDEILKDQTWYIDFIHQLQVKSEISSIMVMKDLETISLSSLDILEARYVDTIKDSISMLTDKIKTKDDGPSILYIVETLDYIDRIRTIITITNTRNSLMQSDSSFTDRFVIDEGSDNDDNLKIIQKLYDLVKVISERELYNYSNGSIDDNIYLNTNETSNMSIREMIDRLKLIVDYNIEQYDINMLSDDLYSLSISITNQDSMDIIDSVIITAINYVDPEMDSQIVADIITGWKTYSSKLDHPYMTDYLFEHDSEGNMQPVI